MCNKVAELADTRASQASVVYAIPMAERREERAQCVDPLSGATTGDKADLLEVTAAAAAAVCNPQEATRRKLFGGAMECLLPAAFMDVSNLRQVPDHQEVFVSRDGGVSVVIEVLSFEEDLPSDVDGASARHFFDDLAAANGASSSVCDFCGDLTDSIMPELASYSKAALAGRQTVAKFRGDGPPESVRVYLANIRLPNVGTDILITVNVPYPDEESAANSPASAECFEGVQPTTGSFETIAGAGQRLAGDTAADGNTRHEEDAGDATREEDVANSTAVLVSALEAKGVVLSDCGPGVAALRSLMRSFAILDWSLFC